MGSSSNNRASQEAERAEAARQAAIRATQGRVDSIFSDPRRAAEIQDAANAQRTLGTQDLNKQKAEQDRQLKFALARNGVIGGSTQLDQQKVGAENYSRALLDVDAGARRTAADIEAQDQQARAGLIGLATSGLDMTSAAQQAASALRTNLEAGKSLSQANTVNLGAGAMADFIKRSREASERRRADQISGFGLYATPARG